MGPETAPFARVKAAEAGPLIAPSANLVGKPPAETPAEAYAYFKGTVDFYVHAGRLSGSPSTLIEVRR